MTFNLYISRSFTRYQMQLCVVVIISFIILHMVLIDNSSTQQVLFSVYPSHQLSFFLLKIQESYVRHQEKHTQEKEQDSFIFDRGFTLPSLDEEIELNYMHNELTDEKMSTKKNQSVSNSIKMLKQKLQKEEEEFKELRDNQIRTKSENSVGDPNSFIDIKPFVNFTLHALGVFDDINEEEPFDPTDKKRIFHSMFQIWSPKVGLIYSSNATLNLANW